MTQLHVAVMPGPEYGLNLVTRLNINYTERNSHHQT